jgi:hypothetical protein
MKSMSSTLAQLRWVLYPDLRWLLLGFLFLLGNSVVSQAASLRVTHPESVTVTRSVNFELVPTVQYTGKSKLRFEWSSAGTKGVVFASKKVLAPVMRCDVLGIQTVRLKVTDGKLSRTISVKIRVVPPAAVPPVVGPPKPPVSPQPPVPPGGSPPSTPTPTPNRPPSLVVSGSTEKVVQMTLNPATRAWEGYANWYLASSDPEGGYVDISMSGQNGAKLSSSRTHGGFIAIARALSPGVYPFTVTVRDPRGASASESLTLIAVREAAFYISVIPDNHGFTVTNSNPALSVQFVVQASGPVGGSRFSGILASGESRFIPFQSFFVELVSATY